MGIRNSSSAAQAVALLLVLTALSCGDEQDMIAAGRCAGGGDQPISSQTQYLKPCREESGGEVSGRVVTTRGKPIPSVRLFPFPAGGFKGRITSELNVTSDSGDFSIFLPVGRFTIRATSSGWVSREKTVTVKDGEITEIEFVLRRAT